MEGKTETGGVLTELLQRWSDGDENAESELLPLVYDELHRIARRIFREERSGHTLQSTAVVHEAYLSLRKAKKVDWQSRKHFFGIMARVMRQVLVDHARRRDRLQRGGAMKRVTLDCNIDVKLSEGSGTDVLVLDLALKNLEQLDPDSAKLVELRYFCGLSLEEVAEVRGVSRTTVIRQWRHARSWLYQELSAQRDKEL